MKGPGRILILVILVGLGSPGQSGRCRSTKSVAQGDWEKGVNAGASERYEGFVNWILSREGQGIVFRASGQATRRLDIDTKWLRETGVILAKDHLSVKEFIQAENQSEEMLDNVRDPAQKFAATILK